MALSLRPMSAEEFAAYKDAEAHLKGLQAAR